jgi:hypothetical protein
MSRTYRITQKGKKASWLPDSSDDYFYWMTTPSYWNNCKHTRPRRAKERQLIKKIVHGYIDPDDIIFPDGRKPHVYFW